MGKLWCFKELRMIHDVVQPSVSDIDTKINNIQQKINNIFMKNYGLFGYVEK